MRVIHNLLKITMGVLLQEYVQINSSEGKNESGLKSSVFPSGLERVIDGEMG